MTDPQPSQPRPTPLTAVHERLGATLTDFAGWLMPLRYGSETAEHKAVRTAAGLFDLSHMGEITVTGAEAAAALDYALVGQPSALAPGRARYTMICAADGGDHRRPDRLPAGRRGVPGRRQRGQHRRGDQPRSPSGPPAGTRSVTDRTADYALIAIQGPRAAAHPGPADRARTSTQVRYYASYPATVAGAEVLLARTGYTGEDGFELFTRPGDAEASGPR